MLTNITNAGSKNSAQRGFTLLEVLCSLSITTVALLGVLKLEAIVASSSNKAVMEWGQILDEKESLVAMMAAQSCPYGSTLGTKTLICSLNSNNEIKSVTVIIP